MTTVQRGFTLVEAVVVIAITGILAAVVAVFILGPVKGYMDSVARAGLTDVADTALLRMTRELRLALPNSIRVNGQYIEFLLTVAGGRYLAEEDNPATGNILDFSTPSNKVFDVVGPMPAVAAGNFIVVYNLGLGASPADAYDCSASCNRATVSGVSGNAITLNSNPFASQPVKMFSPGRRFQVVTTPVTYGCAGGTLTRYSGYAIAPSQSPPPAGGSAAVLATGVTNCVFSYNNLASARSGLIALGITLQSVSAETVTLFHEVHVDNTP